MRWSALSAFFPHTSGNGALRVRSLCLSHFLRSFCFAPLRQRSQREQRGEDGVLLGTMHADLPVLPAVGKMFSFSLCDASYVGFYISSVKNLQSKAFLMWWLQSPVLFPSKKLSLFVCYCFIVFQNKISHLRHRLKIFHTICILL